MKKLLTTLSLMLAVLIGSTGVSYALPECEGSPITAAKIKSWNNCKGTHILGFEINAKQTLFGVTYFGEWKNEKPDGKGTLTFYVPSKMAGRKFVGDFRGGDFIKGTITFNPPHKGAGGKFVGDVRNGRFIKGTMTFNPPHPYAGQTKTGEWKHNKLHGQGTVIFSNGDKHVGRFKDNKRSGQGTFIFANGGKYVGAWMNDKPNGLGIRTHADGRIEEGIFQNGNLLRAEKVAPNKYSATTDVTHPSPNKPTITNNSSSNDIQSRLAKLKKLLDAGLITKEEAAKKRKAILDSL